MIATSFAALPTPDIWPLNTGLGGVTGWILFQQLVRVEEALNFSGVLLVYVVALIGLTIFLWCLGIKVREYIFLARVIQRNLSLIVGTAIKVVPMGSQLLTFSLRSLKPKSKKLIKLKAG